MMATMQQLYIVSALVVFYLLFSRFRQYRRLRHFPGPPTASWSWWWHSWAVLSRNLSKRYGDATERYGPVARVAPNLLVTSDPDLWAKMNGVRSLYSRAPWYYHSVRLEPGKDNIFTECNTEKHDARRKKMISGYSGKENPTLESSIDTHIKGLIHLISSNYTSSASGTQTAKPMDLATKIQYLTLDVISELGLGKPFGDLEADRDVNNYLEATEEGLRIGCMVWGLGIGWLRNLPIIGPALTPSEKDLTGFGKMTAEARRMVQERQTKSIDEKSDMISSFMRHGVSEDDLFQEVFEQILAGSDTTAGAIRIVLLFIMSHPRVYVKLQAEIDGAVKAGIVPDVGGVISDFEVRRLPYLSAVIREGLRIHPPVVNVFARVTPPSGDFVVINGKEQFIPGGTMVGYSAWSMHRNNRSVYGEDAEVFRPERWLLDQNVREEQQRLSRMTKVNDMVFGHGRWGCPGKTIGMMELHKSIFELMRHFDLAIANPHCPWKIFDSMGLWEIKDMHVVVTERR